MESFTKNFKELILLFSGNFHTFLLKNQIKDINIKTAKKFEDIKAQFIKISKCEADIKDERPGGHMLWTIKEPEFFSGNIEYKNWLSNNPNSNMFV